MATLNYHHLRYFHAVAHEGNLTRAAENLGVSQSALSSQIHKLEDRLGQQLFERRGRTLQLTEAGRIALDHADAIFSTGQDLVAILQQTGQVRRPIRIGASATLSRNFQLSLLRPILGRSDVEIILRSGSKAELFQALTALQLDIVLTNQPPEPDALTDFIVQSVDEQSVSLIGHPSFCEGEMVLSERIAAHPLILPTQGSGLRMAFDALVEQMDIQLQIAAEVDDMAMIRLLAREGIGLAVIPPIVVQDELANGVLAEGGKLPRITETFYAVTMRRKFPNPVLEELLR